MSPALSAVMAGCVAVLATLAIERLGGRTGGVLASAPTTIVPFSLGLWSQTPESFADGMGLVPAGMLVNALFLLTWRTLPPRLPPRPLPVQLATMIGASLTVWALAAAISVGVGTLARSGGYATWPVGLAALAVGATVGVLACLDAPPAPAGGRRVAPLTLAARGVLAALAIGGAVTLARTQGPLIAGMASVFPAIFLTTMTSLWVSQGQAVPLGAVGPMILGATSVGVYALAAIVTFPWLGPAPGAAAAWVLGVTLASAPAAAWLRAR